mgnify:CR=1 FL=1
MDINYSKNFFSQYTYNIPLDETSISKIFNITNPLPFSEGSTNDLNKESQRKSNIKWVKKLQSTQWLCDELINLVSIFPSHVQHRVTSVTEGNRKSLVWWVEGPPFK